VFIAFSPEYAADQEQLSNIVDSIIDDFHQSKPVGDNPVYYPGERSLLTRMENLKNGVPLNRNLWQSILDLSSKPV